MRSLYIYAKSGQEGENERKVLAALASLGDNCDVLLGSRYLISPYDARMSQVPLPRDTHLCQAEGTVPRPPSLGSLGTAPHRVASIGLGYIGPHTSWPPTASSVLSPVT